MCSLIEQWWSAVEVFFLWKLSVELMIKPLFFFFLHSVMGYFVVITDENLSTSLD